MFYSPIESEIAFFIVVYTKHPLLLFMAWQREEKSASEELSAGNSQHMNREKSYLILWGVLFFSFQQSH